jgi:hypothetical protein
LWQPIGSVTAGWRLRTEMFIFEASRPFLYRVLTQAINGHPAKAAVVATRMHESGPQVVK